MRAWQAMTMAAVLAALAGAGPAAAQVRYEVDRRGNYQGSSEQRGGNQRHYDPDGRYEGRSERSSGGNVLRHYDADGRYLGREELERDFRRRRASGNAEPRFSPAPVERPVERGWAREPGGRRAPTPWFNDSQR